ncbi:hypothetical protein BA895_17365 [Humibacillus sp. DSM 29435]|uniref:hypothetical protein n=1 Tax=Humibacillus sp. DSM 29435 TaxID=1869167 RepID=UPI0008733229|nr:hypothetical protein [Humibacillus sp. DSM 29435]OFE17218.1 hypothetical protein BA895_17365 [Humibacillus sp. DSM 29435]
MTDRPALRALLGLSRAVVRTWVNRASALCGGRARFRVIVAVLAIALLAVEGAIIVKAGGAAPVGAQPTEALAPSLGVLLFVIGMVMAALLGLTMPDGDELSVFIAPAGLSRGVRRLGAELPMFGLFAVAGAVLSIPMSTNVLQGQLSASVLATRLVGAFMLTVTGLLVGRAASVAVVAALAHLRASRMLSTGLASAVTIVIGGLVMKVTQPTVTDVTRPPVWRRVVGAALVPGWLTPVVVLGLLAVCGAALVALVGLPAGQTRSVVERPAAWLRRPGRRGPLGVGSATALATLREPSVVMWLGFAAAAPLLLRGASWVSALPVDIFAVYAVGLPALTAAYPYGVTRGLRQWRAVSAPTTRRDVAAALVATTALVVGAVALQVVCGLLVGLPPQIVQWPLVAIVFAAALCWGHLTPVVRGESSTWVTVDLLAVVTSALVVVGGVALADRLQAEALVFEPLSLILLVVAAVVVLVLGRRRGSVVV